MGAFELDAPDTTERLATGLARQREEISSFFESLETGDFFAAQGEHWSPAEHLRHLAKSVRPVAGAMKVPKLILGFRFGWSFQGSRSFEQVVEMYRQLLAAGAGAGRFAPSQIRHELSDEEWQTQILERWRRASQQLGASLAGWSDRALDRFRLPHPLLGKLTVREMLFFTLYHNAHHSRRVEERRSKEPQVV
jgi:hypothetical protein